MIHFWGVPLARPLIIILFRIAITGSDSDGFNKEKMVQHSPLNSLVEKLPKMAAPISISLIRWWFSALKVASDLIGLDWIGLDCDRGILVNENPRGFSPIYI
jgi:hypothetical protein